MSLSSLSITTDNSEYSKYSDFSIVTARLSLFTPDIGDVLQVTLERCDNIGVLSTQTITLTSPLETSLTVLFNLNTIKTADGFSRVVQGDYLIRATLLSDPTVTATSPQFAVSLVTVQELKSQYLYGATLYASEIALPRFQPQLITGVTVIEVDRSHDLGVYPLVYVPAVSDSPGPAAPATLSWNGGLPTSLPAGNQIMQMTLVDRRATNFQQGDYIIVQVDPLSLPSTGITENLVLDEAKMTDRSLQLMVRKATSWVENQLGFYTEMRKVATPVLMSKYTDIDFQIDASTFYSFPAVASWLLIDLTINQLQAVYELDGYMNQGKVTQIDKGWIQFNEMAGEIELVPTAGLPLTIMFTGTPFFSFYYNYSDIPAFWNGVYLSGLRDLNQEREPVRDLIARRAAIDILLQAGSAYKGGISSESISRDGVSTSTSYTSSAQYSIYSHLTIPFQQWIDDNLESIKQRLGGLRFVVVE